MKLLRYNCCLVFLLLSGVICCQIEFSSIPDDLQLIPRDKDNTGKFILAGKCLLPEYTQVHSIVKNAANDTIIADIVTNIDAGGTFSVAHQVPVALAEYDLKIYLRNATSELLVKIVHRLTAGDYFIIAGQSNALAASNWDYWGTDEMSTYKSLWIRGIGTNDDPVSPYYPCEIQDYGYYQSASNWLQKGYVGIWGLTLQFNLSMQTGVPNCFINGARAGSNIDQNLATHTPSSKNNLDSCSIYDRLYKKVSRHHVDSVIRGIIWYQGESDAALSYNNSCEYMNKFHQLYTSWKADYPNVEKIFLFQLNTGCNEINLSLLREIQRKISYRYPDVIIMSTFSPETDDRLSDQCHYTTKGYNKIGENMLPLIKKYIYKYDLNEKAILPPKILRIYYSAERQLCLEFDMDVTVQQFKKYTDTSTAFIKDYFFGESLSHLNIVRVTSKNNLVYLNLSATSVKPKKITYLPHSYTSIPTLYTGPWIVSQSNNDLAALSFYNFPVTSETDNTWNKVWSNFGSGEIAGQAIDSNSSVYPGDFDGDGNEELFMLSNGGGMSLLKYNNNNWNLAWSCNVDSAIAQTSDNKAIFKYKDDLMAGDFDGDGRAELFGRIATNPAVPWSLFKFSGQNWKKVWQGNGTGIKNPNLNRKNIYAGDFDGDGKVELLEIVGQPEVDILEWKFNSTDFVASVVDRDFSVPNSIFKNTLVTADFDGDGATDLMETTGARFVYHYKNKIWKKIAIDNEATAFNQNHYASPIDSKIISGNPDVGKNAEIMLLESMADQNTVSFMKLNEVTISKWRWFSKQSPACISSFNDWPLNVLNSTLQRFYFVKANAKEPQYLMAMRAEACGYFLSMYGFDGKSDFPLDTSIFGQLKDQNDFLMYPNPSNGLTTVVMNPGRLYTISVYNLQGELMLDLKNQIETVIIDLSFLGPGMYLVKVESSSSACVKKMIKG